MRQFVVATLAVACVLLFVAVAALHTLRAEARGPLAVSAADLLDMGSLDRLRVSLVSTGGVIVGIQGHTVLVHDRHEQFHQIVLGPQTLLYQSDVRVDSSAPSLEPGAHLTVQGLAGRSSFFAYKVKIAPHHHAIGGLIVKNFGKGLLTIVNRHGGIGVVRVIPTATITLRGHLDLRPLLNNMHVLALAVPDPRYPGLFVADTVHILMPTASARVGGLIRKIDTAANLITIYNKTQDRLYTVEVKPTTRITLNKWSASYSDLLPGDHLTVSGVTDPAHPNLGPNPIVARQIRISSPNFGGIIIAVAPAPAGAVNITLRARSGHLLRVIAPGKAEVITNIVGAPPGRVLDLQVGQHIAVQGQRVGKFDLVAATIKVYPHQQTLGGTVLSVLPGRYRISVIPTQKQVIVHTTSHTIFTLNGRTATSTAVHVGNHIRVKGFDALNSDQKQYPLIIATRVSVTITHHKTVTKHAVKKKTSTQKTVKVPGL